MFFYPFVHSSESILGVWENFHSIHPSGVHKFFFQQLAMISEIFFKEELEVISFQKHVGFSAKQLIFPLSFFFLTRSLFSLLALFFFYLPSSFFLFALFFFTCPLLFSHLLSFSYFLSFPLF